MKEEVKRNTSKSKVLYLEFMRVIATFLVIFHHTEENGFFLFTKYSPRTMQFWLYLSISVICEVAVPIFFAISGAIMLKREESIKKIWKKRIPRIFIILLVFSILYYVIDVFQGKCSLKPIFFFQKLYSDPIKYHLWYLYIYIAYLISLPFLRILVKNMKKEHFYYMFGITIVFNAILPIIDYLVWRGKYKINFNFIPLWIITQAVVYPSIGYFLHNKIIIKRQKKNMLILWIINIITIIITCLMVYYDWKLTGVFSEEKPQTLYFFFNPINLICIFVTSKYIFENMKISKYCKSVFKYLGQGTLGIYLFHVMIMNTSIMKDIIIYMQNIGINYMLVCFIYCIFVMEVGYIITIIIKKIPILKKIV